jgi:DNA (cytosine-5)-methyltransferase 1
VLKAEKRTKYKVVELFAGSGGLALGMENSGLNATMLVEIDKNAATTLKKNRPKWDVRCEDIANVDFQGVEADIVTGGFPCQAFSYAGKRLGFEDTRGTLFFEYARAVQQIKPKMIVAENVKGLMQHENGRTLSTMLKILDDIGYRVEYRVLRAQYLDVAQKRERLVMIGVRKDLSLPICFPLEQDYTIGLREALYEVPESLGQTYTAAKFEIMKLVTEGGYWRDLPDHLQRQYRGLGSNGTVNRLKDLNNFL